jgi:hypothetical protein
MVRQARRRGRADRRRNWQSRKQAAVRALLSGPVARPLRHDAGDRLAGHSVCGFLAGVVRKKLPPIRDILFLPALDLGNDALA